MITDGNDELWPDEGMPTGLGISTSNWDTQVQTAANTLKLGPDGVAGTPDDVEGLEGCQRGFATVAEQAWSDVSRGMLREATSMDELQMRAFWRRWHACIQGRHGPTDCSDRPRQGAIAA